MHFPGVIYPFPRWCCTVSLCFLLQRAFYLQFYSLSFTCSSVLSVKSQRKCFLISYWQYFLVLVGMSTSSMRVTLLHPFPTFWLRSGPNGMHADSLTGCSTSSQSVLPSALHSIMPIKAVSLIMSWRHPYRYYWSLCAHVLVKHLLLMEAEPEGAQLWILSLLSPDGHQVNFSFSLFSLPCFCLCPKATLTAHVRHQL